MHPPQVTGSTSSYARKYALNGLFAIDDTKDSDATNKHGKEEDKEPETPKTLNCEEMIAKMESSENTFELKARRKKYAPDYKALKVEEQEKVKKAGDIRQDQLDGVI